MKIIGLTGGIGSGKSTVAKFFKDKGYSVYNSDTRAKELMVENLELKNSIINLLGNESYINGQLNRNYIAGKIFSDNQLLQEQNKLVHVAVKKDFEFWAKQQTEDFCIKEAAILFESGSYKNCDFTIVVTAPEELRIQRAIKRDNSTANEILKRMKNQWKQEKLIELADFQIINDCGLDKLKIQVDEIISKIKEYK